MSKHETELICMECLGPASIQFVDASGMPVGTLCAKCDAHYRKLHDRISEMFSTAFPENR